MHLYKYDKNTYINAKNKNIADNIYYNLVYISEKEKSLQIQKNTNIKQEKIENQLSKLRNKTKNFFKKILNQEGVFLYKNLKNPIKIVGDYVIIYCLYKQKLYECYIDTEDLDKINLGGTWVARGRKTTDVLYCYCRDPKSKKTITMHRLIMNNPENKYIDHKNGNGLDNRKCNLEISNPGLNMLNKKTYKNSKTGISGIRKIKNDYFTININRRFKDKNIAKQAHKEIVNIINTYSRIDAQKRKYII